MSIKLIISDFDGVLMDLKEIHFETLNDALSAIDEKYVISQENHIKTFDGLSTKRKLEILSKTKGFPLDKIDEVFEFKQLYTLKAIHNLKNTNSHIKEIIKKLKEKNDCLFYVASNAISKTIESGLQKLDIRNLVNRVYSNESIKYINCQKPHSQIYLKCMVDAGVNPNETLIIEDSKHGKEAAVKSGAHVCDVNNSFDFTYELISAAISSAEKIPTTVKYSAKNKLNVLIPCAGLGSRFTEAGYKLPKPLIDVDGKPMIQRVIENLNIDANYIFVIQKEHCEKYNLGMMLKLMVPGCKIVGVDGLTAGAAATTLLAKEYFNNSMGLLIANSDQLVSWGSADFIYSMVSSGIDGGILTFKSDGNSKWSYAKTNEDGFVVEVAEKIVISDEATVGIYYYKHGSDYVVCAEEMIDKNIRSKGEFYIAPVYNLMIDKGKKIKTYQCDKMMGLGTPEDLELFLKSCYMEMK